MLLAVNVDNSRISFGAFDSFGELVYKFKISADINKTADEYAAIIRSIVSNGVIALTDIDATILSSVVPKLTTVMFEVLFSLSQTTPIIIGPGVKTGFPIKIDNPTELGSDIVANTAAVITAKNGEQKKTASVIVDMNTVTTVSAVNKNGEYIGCSIFPGVQTAFDALHSETALLPNVMLLSPQKAIGKNSQEAVRSGVIYGTAFMLDGFVYRFAKEMKCRVEELDLTITGEYAQEILEVCNSKFTYDENLTLKGLYAIYRNNIK